MSEKSSSKDEAQDKRQDGKEQQESKTRTENKEGGDENEDLDEEADNDQDDEGIDVTPGKEKSKTKTDRKKLSERIENFQVRIKIHEGRQMTGSNIKPVVKIKCGPNQTKITRVKKGASPVWEEISAKKMRMIFKQKYREKYGVDISDADLLEEYRMAKLKADRRQREQSLEMKAEDEMNILEEVRTLKQAKEDLTHVKNKMTIYG
uniref:myoferlin-like n=1 Tax=Styela clava TaxID=7725 RepID=UPI001939C4A7|nr:myoferlin-like [Styela clava]